MSSITPAPERGPYRIDFNDAVEHFDVPLFLQQFADTGRLAPNSILIFNREWTRIHANEIHATAIGVNSRPFAVA